MPAKPCPRKRDNVSPDNYHMESEEFIGIRGKLGYLQRELAKELGVTVRSLQRWENSRFGTMAHVPIPAPIARIMRLADAAMVDRDIEDFIIQPKGSAR